MNLEHLYHRLRELIAETYAISIKDFDGYKNLAKVAITPINDQFPWTHFVGLTIEDALNRAIRKFEHPEEDYVELDGQIWRACEESCFSENHIRLFLKQKENEKA